MIIDEALKVLPDEIGIRLGQDTINASAFADDIILFATTKRGLQRNLDTLTGFLQTCGLVCNPQKCFTITVENVPRQKQSVVVVSRVPFTIGGAGVPQLSREDTFRYLGIEFTAEGRTISKPFTTLERDIRILTTSPLKPQQRIFGLRTMVIPALYHRLVLGGTSMGILEKADRIIRKAVRTWLSLHHDVPNAYIHAKVTDGGLGIPAMRFQVPLMRLLRLNHINMSEVVHGGKADAYLNDERETCRKRLSINNNVLDSKAKVSKYWSRKLYETIDGAPLKESARTPGQHRWLQEPTRFLSGRDYINLNKVRINALPTKARSGRGRNMDRWCRAGCDRPETLNHILQTCPRTHNIRVRRHNAIADFIRRVLEADYHVEVEPQYRTDDGVRKPDLVASRNGHSIVIDVQIVGDQQDLHRAHKRKIDYYGSNADLTAGIMARNSTNQVTYSSATLSWRGIWSKHSAEHLLSLGVLKKQHLKIMSTRVLVGGYATYRIFMNSTQLAGV